MNRLLTPDAGEYTKATANRFVAYGPIRLASSADRLMEHGTVRKSPPLVGMHDLEGRRGVVVHGLHAVDWRYIAELATEGDKLVYHTPGGDALNLRGPALERRFVIPEDVEGVRLCLLEQLLYDLLPCTLGHGL